MARKPCPTIYKNVTDTPEAKERAAFGDELSGTLKGLGFVYLGLLQICTNLRFRPEQARQLLPDPDGTMLADALENGEICILFYSPDKRAFAAVENYFGEPVISLRTLLEDGTVIETTKKPQHHPRRVDVIGEPQRMTGLMISSLMASTIGPGENWPRANRPQAGYYVELMETDDLTALWQRHQQRISQLNPHQAALRAHISFELYLCICQRTFMLVEFRGRMQWIITNILFAGFFICFTLGLPVVWQKVQDTSIPWLYLTLSALAGALILGGATMLLRSLAIRHLTARWPGPRLVPTPDLVQFVKKWYVV